MTRQSGAGGTVLVVDDEPEIREIVALNAAQLGYQVLEAGDGLEAQEVVRRHAVDVIISDLIMPRVSGLSLLTELRDAGHIQPVIIVTAYPSQDSTLQALRLGAFDYLEKPFEADELMALLAEAMRVSKGVGAGTKIQKEPSVASEIQKLKTLRYMGERHAAKEAASHREKAHAAFIAEATPQLLFCDAAIKGLARQDERTFELGYLFRVMQALGHAAGALGVRGLERLAQAAERFYTTLRVRPRAVTDGLIELAQRTNAALQVAVVKLEPDGDAANDELIADLDAASKKLERQLDRAG